MTREKRIEALTWLIDQAEAVQSGIVGIEFGQDCDVTICNSVPEVHIYGNGFYEMARAASQIVHNDPATVNGTKYNKEYFLFDGVMFYRWKEAENAG
jgi:hypothetical protein